MKTVDIHDAQGESSVTRHRPDSSRRRTDDTNASEAKDEEVEAESGGCASKSERILVKNDDQVSENDSDWERSELTWKI